MLKLGRQILFFIFFTFLIFTKKTKLLFLVYKNTRLNYQNLLVFSVYVQKTGVSLLNDM